MICKLLDLKPIMLEVPREMIVSFDTEGAPTTISQASMVSADGKEMMNRYIRGNFKQDVVRHFLALFNKTKILIGYNIASDLRALRLKGIALPPGILVVDVYETFMYLLRNDRIATPPTGNCLEEVAKTYGITDVTGYHNSMVDAKVTMRLFWEMYKQTDGKFMILAQMQIPELTPGNTSKEEVEEGGYDVQSIKEYMDYSYQQEEVIRKVSKQIYEAVVEMYGVKVIVRLTKEEYKMFCKIRKMTPDYPLWVFYRTIVAPGVLYREKEYLAKERSSGVKEEECSDAGQEVKEEEFPVGALN